MFGEAGAMLCPKGRGQENLRESHPDPSLNCSRTPGIKLFQGSVHSNCLYGALSPVREEGALLLLSSGTWNGGTWQLINVKARMVGVRGDWEVWATTGRLEAHTASVWSIAKMGPIL